ncbi:hypothetical protein EBI_26100 [Enterocytozoon bieneusi H348]|nr:hypothetical protein EBI_26100 [Enterocytozoon bieneusi H348]|eukprot:XP_002650851.1 hypothetical protein EBI_26100 [Enterocytozoon bieneusi H348]
MKKKNFFIYNGRGVFFLKKTTRRRHPPPHNREGWCV